MAKAATKEKKTDELPAIPSFEVKPRVVKSIPLKDIVVSPFETQAKRRLRFKPESITDLGEDIRINGLTHPILVRPVGKKYEIVAGEKRYLAVSGLGHASIDATVEEMTDVQAFEKQQSENAKRQDNHPMDDAYSIHVQQEQFGYTDEEIAARTGHSLSFIAVRRALLNLSPVVVEAFENDRITLGHAQEIAKYKPEWHQALLDACFSRGDGALHSVKNFIARVQRDFLHRLDTAPFSKKAKDLRPDGLACTECPERTSAHQRLFTEDYDKKDQCLNPTCWNDKVATFVQLTRVKIAYPDRDTAAEPLNSTEFQALADKAPFITSYNREILERRCYPRMCKARKQWNCNGCGRTITPGASYEHSFAHHSDEDNGYEPDIRLCMSCSKEV